MREYLIVKGWKLVLPFNDHAQMKRAEGTTLLITT